MPLAGAEEDPAVFEVNVKCIDGTVAHLEVPGDLRGDDLKELLAGELGIPAAQQRIICRGRVFADDQLISNHIKESGQTLHVVQRPSDMPASSSSGSNSAAAEGEQRQGGHVHLQFSTPGTPEDV